MSTRRFFSVALLTLATCCAGCGESRPKTARLAGRVTLDGQELATGRMQLIPQDSGTSGPATAEIKAGHYECRDAPLGNVRAYISAVRETGKMNTEYSQPFPEVVSLIPVKYAPGIELSVTGDKLDQNFELTSN
jgi:hypothetical protein